MKSQSWWCGYGPSDSPDLVVCAPAYGSKRGVEGVCELVIEILSPSNLGYVLDDKLADYARVSVLECWVVSQTSQTVEVLRLTPQSAETVATYGQGELVQSITFPDLTMPVADVFAS